MSDPQDPMSDEYLTLLASFSAKKVLTKKQGSDSTSILDESRRESKEEAKG